jgi:CRISPR-associated endonuclease Csn1
VVETWKEHRGKTEADRVIFTDWLSDMRMLCDELSGALRRDEIPVTENLRLRLGNSGAHDEKVKPLERKSLREAMTAAEIDRSATPAQWIALTRCLDYTPTFGLPVNPLRSVTVQRNRLGPDDCVEFFPMTTAAIKVRGGYAPIGDTIHHIRVYWCEDAKKPFYAILRVFQIDLLAHRRDDLFEVPLPPQAISRRTADQKLRSALLSGQARYLGWLVEGDELLIQPENLTNDVICEFLRLYPEAKRWRVAGFPDPTRLRLRPRLLAGEGLEADSPQVAVDILMGRGWIVSANVLFSSHPLVVRRNALGQERWQSAGHLPCCWQVD